jgi:hypothetical protein
MDAIAEIKRLYYAATKATIKDDLYRAIDLLKTLPTEEDREKVAVYMDGLAQMRAEWGASASRSRASRPTESSRSASAPQGGGAPGRSGRSTTSSRRYR